MFVATRAYILFFAAFLLTGCGGGSTTPGDTTTRAAFTIHWPGRSARLIPVASESIKVSISNPQGQVVATNLIQRPAAGGDVTVTISPLPAGDLPVSAIAYPDADGTGTAQGTASVVLHSIAGQIQSITISLDSTITSIDVTATSLNVPIGGFQQLLQTPRDRNNNVVMTLPKTITWQSSNASAATVDSTGKVTGVATGTSNITVTETESGKTKTVPVTVGTSSGAIGVITFLGTVGGTFGTYTVHGDGSAVTYVSPYPSGSGLDLYPQISPNRQLVAIGNHPGAGFYDNLAIVNADGTNRPATWSARANNYWSWAPDSTRIVYAAAGSAGGSDGLHVVNANGSGDVKILNLGEYPAWSPDGTRIAASDPSTNQLFLINPDGSNRQNLGLGTEPKWFPSSHRLVFRRILPGIGSNLYQVNDDGTGEIPISDLNPSAYSVSPDGTKIAFSATTSGGGVHMVYVYTVGAATTVALPAGFSPAWSRDGSKIVFGTSTGIHFINPDGSGDILMPGIASASWIDWR